MEIRHNTKLLEEAVALVVRQSAIPILAAEAAAADADSRAKERISRASGFRRLSTAGAIALVIFAVGFFLALYNWRYQVGLSTRPSIEITQLPDTLNAASKTNPEKDMDRIGAGTEDNAPLPPPRPPGIETRDYTIFQRKEITVAGNNWTIEAGHQFSSEDDQSKGTWQAAWCYSKFAQGSMDANINLGLRPTTASIPQGPITSSTDVQSTSLSNADILVMASNCPWLDGKRYDATQLAHLQPEQPTDVVSQGDTLRISGPIGDGLTAKVRGFQFTKVEIDSEGGLVDEALSVGRILRGRNAIVEVKGRCLSACVLILAGGAIRNADSFAQIGVHRFSKDGLPAATDIEIAQQKSSEIYSYLNAMGVSPGLWLRMSSTSSSNMDIIDHDQLRGWNLLSPLTAVVSDGPDLDRTGKGDSAENIPRELPEEDQTARPAVQEQESVSSFKNLGAVDAPGNDLPGMPSRDVSEAECLKLCLGDKACRALTYNTGKRACFLKSKIGTTMPFDRAVTYSRD